jgi:hypothetical protein
MCKMDGERQGRGVLAVGLKVHREHPCLHGVCILELVRKYPPHTIAFPHAAPDAGSGHHQHCQRRQEHCR